VYLDNEHYYGASDHAHSLAKKNIMMHTLANIAFVVGFFFSILVHLKMVNNDALESK
jgi:hypothetical protein